MQEARLGSLSFKELRKLIENEVLASMETVYGNKEIEIFILHICAENG